MNEGESTSTLRRRSIKRLAFIILLTLLAILGPIAFYILSFLYLPMGEGPAGPAVPREPFAHTWTERPVLFVGLGDSVTHGYGSTEGKSYYQRLIANPPDEFADMQGISLGAVLPNMTTLQLAISATTSPYHMEHALPRLPQQDDRTFGIIVLTTGGNDIIHDYGRSPPREGAMYGATWEQAQPWIANFQTRLGEMLDQIDARFPGGCAIFLANIYDPTDGSGSAKWLGFPPWPDGMKILAAYNDIIAAAAEQRANVYLVDMHSLFLGHGLNCRKIWGRHFDWSDPHFWYLWILEDPNDRGYDAIRRLMLIEMVKVLPGQLADKPK